jgi:hypothetical protein
VRLALPNRDSPTISKLVLPVSLQRYLLNDGLKQNRLMSRKSCAKRARMENLVEEENLPQARPPVLRRGWASQSPLEGAAASSSQHNGQHAEQFSH